eukprot:478729_1
MIQTSANHEYNQVQLQQQLTTNQPQKVVIAMETDIGILSEQQFVKFTYELNNETSGCCCCTFRFWSLFGWIIYLVGIIVWFIAAVIYVFMSYVLFTACNMIDTDTFDTNNSDEIDVACRTPLIISSSLLAVSVIELICVSIIIHGVRYYHLCQCQFGQLFAGINALASFGIGIITSPILSMLSFGIWIAFFIINVFNAYHVKKARDAWIKRGNPKEKIIHDFAHSN